MAIITVTDRFPRSQSLPGVFSIQSLGKSPEIAIILLGNGYKTRRYPSLPLHEKR
jgi:hypothetical protein